MSTELSAGMTGSASRHCQSAAHWALLHHEVKTPQWSSVDKGKALYGNKDHVRMNAGSNRAGSNSWGFVDTAQFCRIFPFCLFSFWSTLSGELCVGQTV